jgi:hypothetical protein
MTAAAKRMHDLAARLEQRKQEEQERLDQVVVEFQGDAHAMAKEILRYRRAGMQIADAVDWMRQGAPFAMIGPGPHWRQPQADEGETQPKPS